MIPEFSAQKVEKKTPVKSSRPLLSDINYASNLSLLNEFSNYVDEIKDLENQIAISFAYYNALASGDPVTELSEFYVDLNNEKFSLIDNEFIEFWNNRFQNSIQPIKDLVKQKIGDKKSYYNVTSDSIGTLLNTENRLDDSTTPTYDLYCSIYGAPNYVPVQLRNKISNITKQACNDLSSKTTTRMRANLRNIYFISPDTPPYVDSTVSHGLNLVTDYKFFIDFTNNINRLFLNLVYYYDKLFTFIEYFSNIGNNLACNLRDTERTNIQKIDNYYFEINVEKVNQNVDFLLNKIQNVLSNKTIKNTLSNPITLNRNSFYNRSTNQFNLTPRVQKLTVPAPFTALPTNTSQSFNLDINKFINTDQISQKLNIQNYIPSYDFQSIQLPAGVNTILPELSMPAIPNFLPSINPAEITDLTSFFSKDKLLPGFGLGSFGELVGIAGTFNGGIGSDPMSIFNSVEQVKNIFCNFQLPTFSQPNFDFSVNFFDIANKLLSILPKIGINGFNFSGIMEGLADGFIDNFTKTFDELYNKLFTC